MPPDKIGKRIGQAYRNPRVRPALIYTNNMSPQDVGVPDEFACVICWRVLRYTIVCVNGHRCCRICYSKLVQKRRAFTGCPLCRDIRPFKMAPEVDAELAQQQARCPFVRPSSGVACQWTGLYRDMKNHIHSFPDFPLHAENRPAVDFPPPPENPAVAVPPPEDFPAVVPPPDEPPADVPPPEDTPVDPPSFLPPSRC